MHANSYPIKIGWCGVDLQPVSCLIRHLSGGPVADWSPSSDRVHEISRRTLIECGCGAHDVANWFNAACAGKTVLSDHPGYDSGWLAQLYFDTGIPQKFELLDAAAGVVGGLAALSQPEAEAILGGVHRVFPHPHRAGPDARRAASEFLALAVPDEIDEILAAA